MTTNLTQYYDAALAKRNDRRQQAIRVVFRLLERVAKEAGMPEESFRFWSPVAQKQSGPVEIVDHALHFGDGEWTLGVEPVFERDAEPNREMLVYVSVRLNKDNRILVSVGDAKGLTEDAAINAAVEAIKARIDEVVTD